MATGPLVELRDVRKSYDQNEVLRGVSLALEKRTTLAVMGGLLAFTFTLIPGLGGEFMPQLEEGNLWITAMFPLNVSLDRVAEVMKKSRAVIAQVSFSWLA